MAFQTTVIRDAGDNTDNALYVDTADRAVGVLSDGSVVCLIRDPDAPNVFLLYHSPTGVTWTLKSTISPSGSLTNAAMPYAMAVDANDDLHIAYCIEGGNVFHMELTFSAGPSWAQTTWANSDVFATGANHWQRLGIEILDESALVVCGILKTGALTAELHYRVRHPSMGDWGTDYSVSLDVEAFAGVAGDTGTLSIARDAGGADVSGFQKFLVITQTGRGDTGDFQVWGFETDVDDGVEQDRKTIVADLLDHGWCEAFSTGTGEWTILGASFGQDELYYARLDWDGFVQPLTTLDGYSIDSDQNFSRLRTVHFGYKEGRAIWWYIATASGQCEFYYKVSIVPTAGAGGPANSNGSGAGSFGRIIRQAVATAGQFYHVLGGANRNFDQVQTIALVAGHLNVVGENEYWRGIVNSLIGTPTAVQKPSGGSTVNTDYPNLGVLVPSTTGGVRPYVKPVFKLATDSAFTLNVRNYEVDDSYFTSSGLIDVPVDVASELFQGTWFVKYQWLDEFDSTSFFGASSSFIVSHPPTSQAHQPTGNLVYGLTPSGGDITIPFSWDFADTSPNDSQTAYQILIETAAGVAVLDTGKVVSTANSASLDIADTYLPSSLRWRIRLWDEDDVVGSYSGYHLFRVSEPATVSITAPSGTMSSPAPTVTWTYTPGDGGAQTRFRVAIYRSSDDLLVFNSNWITGDDGSYAPPSAVLENNVDYDVHVYVQDALGVEATDSVVDQTASWTGESQPSFAIDTTYYETRGYVKITFDGSTFDTNFNSWRAYRREVDTDDWELVGASAAQIAGSTILDFLAGSTKSHEYTVVQVNTVGVTSVEIESDKDTVIEVDLASATYWLIDPDIQGVSESSWTSDPKLSTPLYHVTDDPYSDTYEEETHIVIGRGAKRDVGTRTGYAGTLTAHLYGMNSLMTAREERFALEAIRTSASAMWLRNPFGDVFLVNIGEIKMSRIPGVGNIEINDASIPYQETNDTVGPEPVLL